MIVKEITRTSKVMRTSEEKQSKKKNVKELSSDEATVKRLKVI